MKLSTLLDSEMMEQNVEELYEIFEEDSSGFELVLSNGNVLKILEQPFQDSDID